MVRNQDIIGKYLNRSAEKPSADLPTRFSPSDNWRNIMPKKTPTSFFKPINKNHLAIGAGALIFASMFAAVYWQPKITPRDVAGKQKSCPRIIAIMIDSSDKPTSIQETLFEQKIERLPGTLLSGDCVIIFELTDKVDEPVKIIFNEPVPTFTTGMDKLSLDSAVLKNQDKAILDEFVSEFTQAVKQAKEPVQKDYSPIYQGLGFMGVYLRNQEAEEIHLLMAGDFLQNAGGCSHYVNFNSEICGDIAAQIDLNGIAVEAIYLRRPSVRQYQTEDHQQLTQSILQQSGAANINYKEW